MQTQITALLVVHNEHERAVRALRAIESQTLKPNKIVIVDTSVEPGTFDQYVSNLAPKTKLGEIIRVGLESEAANKNHWLWLVHDDSEPQPTALAELIAACENSETIAQVGPLQLHETRSREITQLGLTLSPFGELINPIKGQLDQSQHDQVQDVLAVSTSGMLVRTDAYEEVGGLDDTAAVLAADMDLSIRLRRHGYRVVTAPRAKVVHGGLTLSGKRKSSWLKGSTKTALRRASIQLHLVHDPLPLAILYWFALPTLTLLRMFWRLAQKRPTYLWSELRAGFWGVLTIAKRLRSRANVGKIAILQLAPLRASWATVSKYRRQALENEEAAQSLAAFERGDHELEPVEKAKTFINSGGWIFVVVFALLSWKQFPVSTAVTGGSTIPLSNDWFAIFARAGASWQPIGQGFVGPSDPFNWVLLLLSSLTFWAPNLSIVVLLWLARALAFASAWKMLSLLTAKAWQRNLGAIVYALLPAFTQSITNGEIPAVLSTVLAPWLVFAVARAAGLGRSGSARSDSRTWSWVGISGLLLAVVGAATPGLVVLALVGLGLVAFTKIRRLGYLFWIPLPLFAIYLPLAIYLIAGLATPLAIFAEPTLGVLEKSSALAAVFELTDWTHWGLLALLTLAVASLLTKRWVVGSAIASFGLVTYVALVFLKSIEYPADSVSLLAGVDRVVSSGHAIGAVLGLTVIALAVHLGANLKAKLPLAAVAIILSLVAAPLAWLATTTSNQTAPSDGSVVPLLLQKQAELGTDLQLLVIDQDESGYRTQWLPIAGVHLEDSNLAYRFSITETSKTETYRQIAQVVGDLASGNGAAQVSVLKENQIGYILVSAKPQNAQLVAALESSDLLESAGLTPFGELWRVTATSAADSPKTEHSPWSVTKGIQLATLVGFSLLAIPSRPRLRRATDSAIFIDQTESELDV